MAIGERWTGAWWQRRLPDIGAAATRFPLAIALAAVFTIYKLGHDRLGDLELRMLGALMASFLWVVAVDFYVEAGKRQLAPRIALWLFGLVFIALLFRLAWEIWLAPPILILALLLLVGLAGHLGRGESNSTFWLFNHRLWLGALLALVSAGLLAAGLSAIHATLNLLFGLDLPAKWRVHIWTLSLGFVAPVSFLAFAPRTFTDPITSREEADFTMRAAAALVKFVLVPLLLIYTAILYAYAAKIVLAWELPKGTLAAMVVAYLFVGAATLLLGYPTRDTGGPLVRFFWRNWVWLVALPVVLLFIAVARRIADYGLTEQRYLIVLVGVWALILAGIRIARGADFDLRLLPGVLAFLLFAASFGPGGAMGFSIMSQRAELASILTAKNILVAGKIVPANAGASPLGQDAARARTIEWYLNTHHALQVLAPWFEGQANDPFAPGKKPEETARELLSALGLSANLASRAEIGVFDYYSDTPAVVGQTAAGHVIGPLTFQIGPALAPIPTQTLTVEGLGSIEFALTDGALTVSSASGDRLTFDLAEAMPKIETQGAPDAEDHSPIVLNASSGGLAGTMLIDSAIGSYQEPEVKLSSVRFWLILNRAP